MNRFTPTQHSLRRGVPTCGLLAAALLLGACKDQAPDAPQPVAATPAAGAMPAAAPPPAAAPAAVGTAPAGAAPVAAAATAAAPRKVALSIQGVAPAGVTVRVKGVEIGGDATVLDVSISFANRITDTTMLALADTYLQDESGARLHIKRPDNNRDMTIREGETLDGQLVFMGAVAPSARKLKLVFNDGNQGDNIVAPGLVIDLPLQGV
ncbi:hypothetical protein [Acidovorax radicis]|uniref:hypothetical protein n=1 Tax=Acidovorax radicis TaxID=758826 RepID=UPI001CFA72E5|nr:hypothetical protein [Acidovorax radicis]UCV00419.1 hypothetical protein KI609_06500 [Acidovorax radicis]